MAATTWANRRWKLPFSLGAPEPFKCPAERELPLQCLVEAFVGGNLGQLQPRFELSVIHLFGQVACRSPPNGLAGGGIAGSPAQVSCQKSFALEPVELRQHVLRVQPVEHVVPVAGHCRPQHQSPTIEGALLRFQSFEPHVDGLLRLELAIQHLPDRIEIEADFP